MKLTKSKLKKIIREELLTERNDKLERWKRKWKFAVNWKKLNL